MRLGGGFNRRKMTSQPEMKDPLVGTAVTNEYNIMLSTLKSSEPSVILENDSESLSS